MAFIVHSTDDGRVPGIEYHPAGAITPKVGMALAFSGGKLTTASGTTSPGYISMIQKDTALTAGDVIPVIRVSPDMIFSVQSSVAMTAINSGDRVTLGSDGLTVTATTTGGVAEVVSLIGTEKGGEVLVRF